MSEQIRYQPLTLRIWHWLDALVILGMLGTVLLRKTFLSWRTNSAFIRDALSDLGVSITPEQAKEIAVGLRDPMWEWHYVLGFTLAGLLVLRIGVALLVPTERPLARLVQALRARDVHAAAVKALYASLYLAITFMVTTGLLMYFELVPEQVKEFHELTMWFFPFFVGVHIAGVVVAEFRGARGIISNMIHGGEP